MDFWRDILGSPTKIVAPMVEASELAWRLLSRKYGAQLCYTPMIHSASFVRNASYRKQSLASCEDDKLLIIQFCGNDPQTLLEAALLAQDHCLAIDINFGCPQDNAKKGHYGAFLQDEWPLLQNIVSLLSKNLKVPVTCKVRRFETKEKTVEYAKMLEAAGCKMLTVHARLREQKGPLTGLADWSFVKAVREAVNIPVISNGNIQNMQDLEKCLEETGAVGVMTAEGNLYNPALFMYQNPPCWEPALEYLDLVERHPCSNRFIRPHLFKLFHHVLCLPENKHLRIELGDANMLDEFRSISKTIKEMYNKFHIGQKRWTNTTEEGTENLVLPPWLCQPYVRDTPEDYLRKVEDKVKEVEERFARGTKRCYEDADGNTISRNGMNKMRRILRGPEKPENYPREKCPLCKNILSFKCSYKLCKTCCQVKSFVEKLDCEGHIILVKTQRELAKLFGEEEKAHIKSEQETTTTGMPEGIKTSINPELETNFESAQQVPRQQDDCVMQNDLVNL